MGQDSQDPSDEQLLCGAMARQGSLTAVSVKTEKLDFNATDTFEESQDTASTCTSHETLVMGKSARGTPSDIADMYEEKYGPLIEGMFCGMCKQGVRQKGFVSWTIRGRKTSKPYVKCYPCNNVRKRAFDLALSLPLEKKKCWDQMAQNKKKEFYLANAHELDGLTDTSFYNFVDHVFEKYETSAMNMEGSFVDEQDLTENTSQNRISWLRYYVTRQECGAQPERLNSYRTPSSSKQRARE